jgi:hypothetical protein
MFPLTALLSHAELNRRNRRPQPTIESVEARRATRRTRYGNLTIFPVVEHGEPMADDDGEFEEPRLAASISNVSTTGVGLILSEELPDGLEFDCQWPEGEFPIPLRFEVVHSQPISAGMYRTGARLIAGVLPEEQSPSEFVRQTPAEAPTYELRLTSEVEAERPATQPRETETPAVETLAVEAPAYPPVQQHMESSPMVFAGGVLHFEPERPEPSMNIAPAPAGTFRAAKAFGFDKTETLNGTTTCGWDRSIQIRRDGDRLWVYIHSPGKKNGWGIFVDANDFESAMARVQQTSDSPFTSTMAA